MRLDVPKFNGSDPESWIFASNEYFSLLETTPEQRLRIIGFNLEADAAEWYRWMTRNKLITSWDGFLESVQNQFGLSKYEDPQGALSKLLHAGSVAQYQSEFEKLMNQVTNVSESLLISFYISGLKPAIQRELLASKPTSVGDAFALARVTEAQFADHGSTPAVATMRDANTWVREHKCSGKFILLMTDEDDESPGSDALPKEDEALESGDISILNSLVGHGSPRFSMDVDLYVLPMQGPDVVLGIQWLQKLGKGDKSLRMKRISLHRMQALLETNDVYGIYELHNLSAEEHINGVESQATSTGNYEIDQLLIQFDSLFQVPTSLPPHRLIDHRIHLLPNMKPVNVRPYRYPHYQNGEMEKIVDYRALNAVTVKDKFLIPTTDEMFDEVGGARIFTKLDLRAGYHQIRVYDRDIYKTAFRTQGGHYEFLVMPFGLTNAPYTFQATMNRLFSPYLRKFVSVFFDDIIIYSTTLTAYVEHLQCVFQCLQEHKFFIKKSKCVFGVATLEYLGHIISNNGVEMDPKKIAAVIDWLVPTNQRQVRGFLGLAGYYRRFIQGYAMMAAPLTNILQKDEFKWGELEFRAFEGLKQQLTNAPVLGLPNFNETFVVEADASAGGIGVILLQNNKPICYFSRSLGTQMRIAATYQKELFAIVEAIYKWRQYVVGRKFIVRTDHKSIKELLQQVIQTPLQHKYVRKLMGFDFVIEYKPGVSNQAADALSSIFEEEEVTAVFLAISQPVVGLVSELKQENEVLEELHELHERMDRGELSSDFRRENRLLLFRDRYYLGAESKLKTPMLHEFHNTPSAGHGRSKKMLVGLSALFYWKGGLLQPLSTPYAIGEDVSVDFITRFPPSKGLTVILVVVDRFSKYAHFGALSTNFNAHMVVEVFMDIVVKHHGIPKTIVSDRDPIFVSKFWKQLFQFSGTQLNHSTAYHPQMDGQKEAKYCHNTSYHSSIKMSPYQALYGKLPPLDIPYPRGSSKVAIVDEALGEQVELLLELKQNLLAAKNCMEMKANRHRRKVEFNPGDKVLVKLQPYRQLTLAKRLSNKLSKRYYGPYEILERVGKVTYRLALPETSKIHPVFHISILKAFSGNGIEKVSDLPEELYEGRPVEQPLTVCDAYTVLRNGIPTQQILVQWVGGSPEEAT
uniref:Ty3/gypsy retrotransposon protein n=1 Tax=Tanacetum cinerariifolium TaxID=118510 RepID=A0A6L2NRY1_TANCI|nr:Ty3/gypsy retrotransposon protein [Tanacetum cinerariifolium]